MRNIYPKLITTLFFILLAAMVLKYGDNKTTDTSSKTASLQKEAQKRM
jgi:hypothetical protein